MSSNKIFDLLHQIYNAMLDETINRNIKMSVCNVYTFIKFKYSLNAIIINVLDFVSFSILEFVHTRRCYTWWNQCTKWFGNIQVYFLREQCTNISYISSEKRFWISYSLTLFRIENHCGQMSSVQKVVFHNDVQIS